MHLWWRRGWKKREKFLNGVIWEQPTEKKNLNMLDDKDAPVKFAASLT